MQSTVLLMRREALWCIRWMFRGRGLALTFLFIILALLEVVATTATGQFGGLQRGLMLDLSISMELCAFTFAVILWLYLFWRRTLAFFRPERLADILLAPFRAEELWPAMLGAPITLAVCLAAIWEVQVLLMPLLLGEPYYLLRLYLLPASSMSPEHLGWIQAITWLRAPLVVLEAGVLALASASAGAYFVLPRGGSFRLVVVLALVQLLVAPEILFSIWIDDRAVRSGTVAQPFQLICDHVLGPMLTIVLAWLTFRLLLRLLQGKNFWDRLRAEVERAG